MYILYITCSFFTTIRWHIGWHVPLTRESKMETINYATLKSVQKELVEYLFWYHHTKISPITSLWNIFLIFHTLWQVLFWSKYIITYKILIFYWIFLKNSVHQVSKIWKFPKFTIFSSNLVYTSCQIF
jgi:hypothetical protein